MKSYNHFLHCLDAGTVFEIGFTLLNRGQHCREMMQNGKHMNCTSLVTYTYTFSLHKHTWTSVVTLRLTRCVPSRYITIS